MIHFKKEAILFIVQALFLILFSFILKDILAALIVSFFSRPLSKIFIDTYHKNLNKEEVAEYND